MTLTVGKPRVVARTCTDEKGRKQIKYQLCVTVENKGKKAIKTCITFRKLETGWDPNDPSRYSPAPGGPLCTVDNVNVVGLRKLKLGSAYGSVTEYCDLDRKPQPGDRFEVAVGTKKKNGHVDRTNSETIQKFYQEPRRVALGPQRKVPFSVVIGEGYEEVEALAIATGLDLPLGWDVTVEGPEELRGPYPQLVSFNLSVAPGAPVGQQGRVVVQTFLGEEPKPDLQRDEHEFIFQVASERCECEDIPGAAAAALAAEE